MLAHGVIEQADMDLIHFVETAEEAWAVISDWYQLA
jgi:predicted Rossmann-fold nucleotide-binding protein